MNEELKLAIFRAPGAEGGWWRFESPAARVSAATAAEVPGLLSALEAATRDGLWAAGFVAYEAAPALDAALRTHRSPARPVATFGFFERPLLQSSGFEALGSGAARVESLSPALDESTHRRAVQRIRAGIADGDVYQVNLTFPVRGQLRGEPERLFLRLAPASGAAHAAFLDLGERAVVSLSPELFFELEGSRIVMRPMKGTRRRGRFPEEDEALAVALRESAKDRAENLMIVDMARNDLGKIARAGSVAVESFFDLERYPTVWQATSTVAAETEASVTSLFEALFPCASVTGAPKTSAMRFIEMLEPAPRGVYCGAIGWVAPAPERRARFSVAIRTAVVERSSGELAYGVGGGIVWDSRAEAEYDECLAKAGALEDPGEPLGLIETMRWSPGRGVRFLERHLTRMGASARYWGIDVDVSAARAAVAAAVAALPSRAHRVRLELDPAGHLAVTCSPVEKAGRCCIAVLAGTPVASGSPLLFHKTTKRAIYERAGAGAAAAGAEEAILWNERGEVTEGTKSNVLVRRGGRWWTPARGCGLLAGVMRGYLLDRGFATEAVLTREELRNAESILVVSALRGIRPVKLLEAATE